MLAYTSICSFLKIVSIVKRSNGATSCIQCYSCSEVYNASSSTDVATACTSGSDTVNRLYAWISFLIKMINQFFPSFFHFSAWKCTSERRVRSQYPSRAFPPRRVRPSRSPSLATVSASRAARQTTATLAHDCQCHFLVSSFSLSFLSFTYFSRFISSISFNSIHLFNLRNKSYIKLLDILF